MRKQILSHMLAGSLWLHVSGAEMFQAEAQLELRANHITWKRRKLFLWSWRGKVSEAMSLLQRLLGFHNPELSPLACLSTGREKLVAESGSSGCGLNFGWREKVILQLAYLLLHTERCEVVCVISSFPSMSLYLPDDAQVFTIQWGRPTAPLLLKRCFHLQLFVQSLSVGVWQSGMLLILFLSCSPIIIGYVDCWKPACFHFSLLLVALNKLWLSLAERDFRGFFLHQKLIFFFFP